MFNLGLNDKRFWVYSGNEEKKAIQKYQLAHLDHYEDNFSFMSCHFYHETQDLSIILSGLKKALQVFPMFGGRLQGKLNERYFDCQDRGILCEEHYLRQSMQNFFEHELPKSGTQSLGMSMIPQLGNRSNHPLLLVKLNHLLGGGSILAVTYSHSVADGSSFCQFLNAWARLSLGEDITKLKSEVHLDRFVLSSLENKSDIPIISDFPQGWKILQPMEKLFFFARILTYLPKSYGKVFPISSEAIDNLKNGKRVSSNFILTALIWKMYGDLEGEKCSHKSNLFFPIDCRKLLPTNGKHYFGNAVAHISITKSISEVRKTPLIDLAREIHHSTTRKYRTAVKNQYSWIKRVVQDPKFFTKIYASVDHFSKDLLISNISKLPYYELDFGKGKPFYFTLPPTPAPRVVHMLPHPLDANGVYLHVNDRRMIVNRIQMLLEQHIGQKFTL